MGVFKISRERMVNEQLAGRGITDALVLAAMREVPRHNFVPEALRVRAYEDHPLPIGHGQTISQPYVVASMCALLRAAPGMKVLEVGTGSGYQAAVLAAMGLEVYTVERLKALYFPTCDLLIRQRCRRVKVKLADGTEGWPEAAPFDRIIVAAGGPSVPKPLVDQLADPGLLVIPVGVNRKDQRVVVVKKENGAVVESLQERVAFVDLVGSHGWRDG